MNKLKKVLALVATLAIASTAFVACGDDSSSTADSSSMTEDSSSQPDDSSSATDDKSSTDDGAAVENKVPDTGDTLSILCWTGDDINAMIENFTNNTDYTADQVKFVQVGSKGQEAREQYANYFQGSEDVDLFVLEADWILDYINNDDYTAPLTNLGFKDSDFNGSYAYVKAIGTDNNGVLKGTSWQATPGAYVYRADLAETYLGVKTPEEMQAKVKDWDTFTATAKEVYEASGNKCAMADTLSGMWQVWQYNRSKAWTDGSDNLQIDDFCKTYAELAKQYYNEGLVTKEDAWTPGWYTIGQNDSTMGYFFCTWCLGKGSMLSNAEGGENGPTYGKYRMTAGPSGWAWGGSWLALSPKADNGTMAHDFVNYFTVDESTMENYARFKGEFVNNPTVMKKIADDKDYGNDLLGGQNQASILYEAAGTIDMDGKITKFDAQIKDAFNSAVTKFAKDEIKTYDEMIEKFKDEAAKIEGLNVD